VIKKYPQKKPQKSMPKDQVFRHIPDGADALIRSFVDGNGIASYRRPK